MAYTLDHNLSPSQSIHFSSGGRVVPTTNERGPIVPLTNEASGVNNTNLGTGFYCIM